MAALESNPGLLLAGFLRLARRQADPKAWLEAIQSAAFTGNGTNVNEVLDRMQDQFASGVGSEGANTQWLREMSCLLIAQLCEAALQTIEAEEAAEEQGVGAGGPGSVRHADFSGYQSVLG